MKLVIDIDENEFKHVQKVWKKRRGSFPYTNIAFGIPLEEYIYRMTHSEQSQQKADN